MAKEDMIEVEGTVVDTLPNAMFKVELEKRASSFSNSFWQDSYALYSNFTWRQGDS